MNLLLDSALRVSVVTAIALVGVRSCGGGPPRSGTGCWRRPLSARWCSRRCSCLCPRCRCPLPRLCHSPGSLDAAPTPLALTVGGSAPFAQSGAPGRVELAAVLGWFWLGGTALLLAALSAGFARLGVARVARRRRSRSQLAAAIARAVAAYGLTRSVRLLQSTHPALLVTWGIRSPKILLPAAAARGRINASASSWRTSSPTSAAGTGCRSSRRSCCARSTGSTRSSGWRAGGCARRASTPATTPCSRRRCGRAGVCHPFARSGEGIFSVPPRLVARARDRPVSTSKGESGPCSTLVSIARRLRDRRVPSLSRHCWP